ncbi:SprT-like family-domain-containing protein [Gamsiella multidivaricata]|uniref:SprT-like family-domain-containing protein n=1 Tax=Gamsiella multidivaricata TaxID=101098 RepID=UPI00221E63E9|nr:SprT-like family-domain-containing protein [Gamsiella multidivaricata]KAI7826886.1 SprT-like family-domain-containing protein [Gamsiella multidivaricata]
MEQSDEDFARLLQEQEYESAAGAIALKQIDIDSSSPFSSADIDDLNHNYNNTSVLNIDTEAPFKDLHGLFLAFNDQYFESKLSACEVRWSPRMTRCAGLCLYQARSHYCSIRLSEPLLKFRPESDYIDTLLHEMIHAYLFVTKSIQDHDGHGVDFQYHMNRINQAAGTTITIYHTFHDEVRYYQTHIWKCDGPCQHQPPYYGIVKRSMNRAPQPADRWFAEHQEKCGGTYTKISEPEPTKKKSSSSKQAKNVKSESTEPRGRTMLDDFLSQSKTSGMSSTSNSYRTVEEGLVVEQETDFGMDAPQSNSGSTARNEKCPGTQRPSPREAAAAAALARFERQLKILDRGASPTTDPTTTTPPKRKDLSTAVTYDFDSTVKSSKKIKQEEDIPIKNNKSLEAEQEATSLCNKAWGTTKAVKLENQEYIEPTTSGAESNHERSEPAIHLPIKAEPAAIVLVQCPICVQRVEEATINDHVDLCIWRASGEND